MARRSLRRLCALLCALMLTLTLTTTHTSAVLSGVYFTVVNDDPMELNQETMPFISGGQIYVSNAIFSGIYGKSLGVSCAYSSTKQTATVFTIRTALFFDLANHTTTDNRGNTYSERAVVKGNYVFFPLSLLTRVFDLTYSYTMTDTVPVIRIKSDSVQLDDSTFFDAASGLLASNYAAYEKEVTAATTPTVTDPPPEEEEVVYEGQRIYLIFTVTDGEETRALLDTLDRYNACATFLMTAQQMEEEQDLLREITGRGHTLGILPTEEGGPVTDQLERANDALWAAARMRTRLVWLSRGLSGEKQTVQQAGYCVMRSTADYSRSPLTSSTRAENLYTHISGISSRSHIIYLGEDSSNQGGLSALLSSLDDIHCRLLAYREVL